MKAIPTLFIGSAVMALIVLAGGCASYKGNNQSVARQQFVPTSEAAAQEGRRGASWTALVPLNDGTGISRLMAHAGIGDRFPVKEVDGRYLFEVLVLEGNDDHLLVEVRSVESSQKIDLVRDKSVQVQIGGSKYDLAYPSVTVAAAKNERPTTNQAMLMIHRRP